MKIKRIKKLKVNAITFNIKWDKSNGGASFQYGEKSIIIGTISNNEEEILELIIHELFEICAVEMHVRLNRPDVESDYIFVFDHRQHTAICAMLAGLLSEFIH